MFLKAFHQLIDFCSDPFVRCICYFYEYLTSPSNGVEYYFCFASHIYNLYISALLQ